MTDDLDRYGDLIRYGSWYSQMMRAFDALEPDPEGRLHHKKESTDDRNTKKQQREEAKKREAEYNLETARIELTFPIGPKAQINELERIMEL